MDINLDDLSLKELKKLHKDVEKTINEYEDKKLAEARSELEARAKEMGFSLHDLIGERKPRARVAPKYRHPENAELTWTGRGRKPRWIEDALGSGSDLEDFLIPA